MFACTGGGATRGPSLHAAPIGTGAQRAFCYPWAPGPARWPQDRRDTQPWPSRTRWTSSPVRTAGSRTAPAPGQRWHQEKRESTFQLIEELEIRGAGTVGMKSTSTPEVEVLSPISVIAAGHKKPISDVRNLRMCESS